jgi:transcriptional regulator with XRE-family HTH domain
MPTKPQHARRYARVPKFLCEMRSRADLTQRELAKKLEEPQSWVYKCENGIRRVDIAEFCDWARACGVDPSAAVKRFIRA